MAVAGMGFAHASNGHSVILTKIYFI